MTTEPTAPARREHALLDRAGPEPDPEPVGEVNADGDGPFFLICDHAGNAVPKALGDLGLPQEERDRHIGIDIGALGVALGLAERLGAPLVYQRYSRLVIDCNRRPEATSCMGEIADGTRVPGNAGLDERARRARVAEIMEPYHARITARLDARAAAGRPTILVAVHSFTPRLRAAPADRPWIVGLCWFHADRFSRHLLAALAEQDPTLRLGENEPYTVDMVNDYSIPVHGEGRGLPYAEIEVRQDRIATPADEAAWADRLAQALRRAAVTFEAETGRET
ncbi:N-formylglutamate amidohydrolase [Salinarimonas rosea]|uniref:N-formylglutamate amidohydrolase n=1 Tax=Salinarimonas rosea TaxID=552063 RepID=UPI000402C2A5|nr:N-formylglutamate amidohydrolase [Salinarimonas rosea]